MPAKPVGRTVTLIVWLSSGSGSSARAGDQRVAGRDRLLSDVRLRLQPGAERELSYVAARQ